VEGGRADQRRDWAVGDRHGGRVQQGLGVEGQPADDRQPDQPAPSRAEGAAGREQLHGQGQRHPDPQRPQSHEHDEQGTQAAGGEGGLLGDSDRPGQGRHGKAAAMGEEQPADRVLWPVAGHQPTDRGEGHHHAEIGDQIGVHCIADADLAG
jgi:hypothetical protein